MAKLNQRRLFNPFVLITLVVAFLAVFGCGGGGSSNSSGGGAANTAPTADAGPDQPAVNEFDLVTLDGSGSVDPEGGTLLFQWVQTAGPAVALSDDTAEQPTFTATDVGTLTFELTVTDDDGASDSDVVTVVVNQTALLSGSVNVSPDGSVNLTGAGLVDWAHWGLNAASDFNQKAGVTNQISNFTKVSNVVGPPGGPVRFTDAPVAFSWNDGTPDVNATDTTTGIFFPMNNSDGSDVGQGYSLTIDADTTSKSLTLHVGGQQAEGRLVATLSDNSAGPFEVSLTNENGIFTNVVTLTFKALSDSQTLNVEYTLANDFGTVSNLTLLAAELDAVAKPTISPSGGVFTGSVEVTLATATPGAEIRYTDDGTEPNASSNLFTGPFTVSTDTTIRAKGFLGGEKSPEASADFTVNPANLGGSLSAFVNPPPASVDLTTEGTLDWAHWGLNAVSDFNQKAGVTNQISNFTEVNNPNGPIQFADNPVAFSWNDGSPDGAATDTTTGIFFVMPNNDGSDVGQGYSLTVDADDTTKIINLYLGGLTGEGVLEASLSDGSASDAVLLISNEFGVFTRVVTIEFRAASPGQSLTIEYTLNGDFGTPSNLTLQAATLK